MNKNSLKFIKLDEVDSTNDYASRRLSQLNLPICVTADYQTSGRGQGKNSWHSEKAENLLFSYAFSPEDLTPGASFYVSRIASLALKDFYSEYFQGVKIKWPNDILYENKKLAGILIENRFYGDCIDKSVIGMGLNINQEEFPVFSPAAGSIRSLTGKTLDLSKALPRVLEKLEYWIDILNHHDFALIVKEYNRHLFRLMENAVYKSGDELFEARLYGVEDDGRLILLKPSGQILKYTFKEVEFIFS